MSSEQPPPPELASEPELQPHPELQLATDAAANAPIARNLGLAALLVAILAVALEIVAITVGSAGEWVAATVLAWTVVALTVVAFVGGLAAVIRNHRRRLATAALVLAVLGNPLVLVALFDALSNAAGGGS